MKKLVLKLLIINQNQQELEFLIKTRISNNINILHSKFIEIFPKFNLYIKKFDYLDHYN